MPRRLMRSSARLSPSFCSDSKADFDEKESAQATNSMGKILRAPATTHFVDRCLSLRRHCRAVAAIQPALDWIGLIGNVNRDPEAPSNAARCTVQPSDRNRIEFLAFCAMGA